MSWLSKLFKKKGGWSEAPDVAQAKGAWWKQYLEGIDPTARKQMYEKAREGGLREARGARQSLLRRMARMGTIGSPASAYKETEMQEGMVPAMMGVQRDIGLASEEAKERGLAGYAGLTGKMKKKTPWYQKVLGGALGLLGG